MKKKLLTTLFLIFCISVMADEPKSNLVVWQTNGSRVFYPLDESPVTTFFDNNLIITTTKLRIEYSMSLISRYTFDSSLDMIDDIQANKGIAIWQKDDELIIYNLPKGEIASIYSINGMQLCSVRSSGQEQTCLSLSKIKTNTFIIKVDKITYKLFKQ